MKHLLPLLLCCAVWPVLAAKPTALRFQRVVIDDKPPQSPWVKITGDLNGDGKPDIIIGGAKGPLVWAIRELHCGEGDGLRVADLNGDGRPDVLGANHGGAFQPMELWRNGGK